MRILYISKSIIPSRSANSIHVMKMCQAFSDNGHQVVLLAPNIKNKFEKNVKDIHEFYGVKKNFKLKRLWHPNSKLGAIFYTIGIFFYLFISKNFHLVYGRFLHGCFIATLFKNKVIFEIHEIIFDKKNHVKLIFKLLIKSRKFKKLVVISKALKQIYLKNDYLNKINIHVAHDGADEVDNFDLKVKLMGSNKKLKIGYLGHLYKGRGIETIIQCAKNLNEMTFHIVGGMESDIQYWKNYIKNIKINNLFFYGFKKPKETIKYLNSFDIFLAPYEKKVSILGNSDSDTSKFMSPLKIFEYMSHKKPLIVSDFPVIREILNKKNSILVKSDDIESWISAIKKLQRLKNREALSHQALKDFFKYTWRNRALSVLKNH